MNNSSKSFGLFLLISSMLSGAYAQDSLNFTSISLDNLSAFEQPPANWKLASGVKADRLIEMNMAGIPGTGVIVNDLQKNDRMHLYTKETFGDVALDLDFMMAKNSNSGVYLQGRYEIQLLDSWKRLNATSSDLGAIYSRWNPERGSYEGTPPAMNVAKAPGLWQHLQLKFRAPRFDSQGKKIQNARFEEVYINGVLVQEAADVTGPTNSSMFQDEVATGPLVLQGDHGKVAFQNLKFSRLSEFKDSTKPYSERPYWDSREPVFINPTSKNYVFRSYMEYRGKTLTHVVSIGSTKQINFTYDFETGAIIQVWRGKFLDVRRMWVGRGEPQLAVPMGGSVMLSDAPVIATLPYTNSAWPDTVAFDDFVRKGYVLDNVNNPTFLYSINGTDVRDSISVAAEGEGLNRQISVTSPGENMYCRLIEGKDIVQINDSLYAINDKSLYLKVDKKLGAVVRTTITGQQLIVQLRSEEPIVYSLIW